MITAAFMILALTVIILTNRVRKLDGWVEELSKSVAQDASALLRLELEQAKAKGYAETTRDLAYGTSDRVTAIAPILEKLKLSAYSVQLDPYETAAKIGSLEGKIEKLQRAAKTPAKRGKK